MSISDVASLLKRTQDVLSRLGLPVDEEVQQIDAFLFGPVVLAVAGSRALGKEELAECLCNALPNVSIRTDFSEVGLELALIDAIILVTPCDAALSSQELETIRTVRMLKRPVSVVVTDAEQLGNERAAGQKEIEGMRLRPLLDPEAVGWCFRAKGEGVGLELNLIQGMLTAGPERLHGKPSADLLARTLDGTETAFLNRCQIRDRELEILRQSESQGALDLAQLAEWEKVERLRVGDRIRQAFEKILVAAEGTGDALSAWTRSGALGDGKDATSTIEEEWLHFSKEIEVAPREVFDHLHQERRRLEMRIRDVAASLFVELPPEVFPEEPCHGLAADLADAAGRIAGTSIDDLIEAAICLAKESADQPKNVEDNKAGLQYIPRRLQAAVSQPLNLADRIRGHLVQGIRSRVDIRLKSFVERLEHSLKNQTIARLQEWESSRNDVVDRMRATLAERHAWSSVLGELQVLRLDIEEYRRTLS
jgi:hypothetical protein